MPLWIMRTDDDLTDGDGEAIIDWIAAHEARTGDMTRMGGSLVPVTTTELLMEADDAEVERLREQFPNADIRPATPGVFSDDTAGAVLILEYGKWADLSQTPVGRLISAADAGVECGITRHRVTQIARQRQIGRQVGASNFWVFDEDDIQKLRAILDATTPRRPRKGTTAQRV